MAPVFETGARDSLVKYRMPVRQIRGKRGGIAFVDIIANSFK